MSYIKKFNPAVTPQNESQPGKVQVKNAAGGHVYPVDKWTVLDRFLVIGTDKPTYYASAKKLTIENSKCVLDCIKEDFPRTVARVVEISDSGRAPKNDSAVFVMALLFADGAPAAWDYTREALKKVCRTGTHLFQFVDAINEMRGWGRGLRRAIAEWYLDRSPDSLAYQLVKYPRRGGWSHRDLLRLSHPKTDIAEKNALFKFVVDGMSEYSLTNPPKMIEGLQYLRAATADKERAKAIVDYKLPREVVELVDTELLSKKDIWEALLESMPLTAMIRNLGKMTAIDLLTSNSAAVKRVQSALSDKEYLHKSRIHPMAILIALKTYAQGHGDKGKLHWQPVSAVSDVLDAAFYAAFANVEPTGKRRLLAIDKSGSMDFHSNVSAGITAREAAAAIALVTKATEPESVIIGFDTTCQILDISGKRRLDDVVSYMRKLNALGTDCAQPILKAAREKWLVDSFEVYTDNDTWAGKVHPDQALREYRKHFNLKSKMVFASMTPTHYSCADPSDGGMLDVVGFDAAVPKIIADFVRGGGSEGVEREEEEQE